MLVHEGRPFLVDDHLARAEAGAEVLGMRLPYTRQELREGICAAVRANAVDAGVVRLTFSRGSGERGLAPGPDLCPTVVICIAAGVPYDESCYTRGLGAILLPWPRNERSPLAKVKSLSCLDNVLGAIHARQAGAREGLFMNTAGCMADGTMTNLFVVKDGRLVTTPLDSGALPGVTRAFIMRGMGGVDERTIIPEDLLLADEAFLTNSVLGVAPLVRVDGRPIGNGRPGRITGRVLAWYRAELGW